MPKFYTGLLYKPFFYTPLPLVQWPNLAPVGKEGIITPFILYPVPPFLTPQALKGPVLSIYAYPTVISSFLS
jgi:hypothetical protein